MSARGKRSNMKYISNLTKFSNLTKLKLCVISCAVASFSCTPAERQAVKTAVDVVTEICQVETGQPQKSALIIRAKDGSLIQTICLTEEEAAGIVGPLLQKQKESEKK